MRDRSRGEEGARGGAGAAGVRDHQVQHEGRERGCDDEQGVECCGDEQDGLVRTRRST